MEWREHEHEKEDIASLNHPETIQALENCGLYKCLTILGMKSQLDLLQWIVDKWNVEEEFFIIGDHIIIIDVDDIYFLMGLPCRGVEINMFGHR